MILVATHYMYKGGKWWCICPVCDDWTELTRDDPDNSMSFDKNCGHWFGYSKIVGTGNGGRDASPI